MLRHSIRGLHSIKYHSAFIAQSKTGSSMTLIAANTMQHRRVLVYSPVGTLRATHAVGKGQGLEAGYDWMLKGSRDDRHNESEAREPTVRYQILRWTVADYHGSPNRFGLSPMN